MVTSDRSHAQLERVFRPGAREVKSHFWRRRFNPGRVLLISGAISRCPRAGMPEEILFLRSHAIPPAAAMYYYIRYRESASPAAKRRFVPSARVLGEKLTRRHGEINDRPRLKVLHGAQFAPRVFRAFPFHSGWLVAIGLMRLLGRATGDHFGASIAKLIPIAQLRQPPK